MGFIAKGREIFNSKFKVVSIFIVGLGMVGILSAFNSEENSNRIKITDNYSKKNNSEVIMLTLENNLTFDINMLVKYSVDQSEFIPIESNSYLTGFVSGYQWEFTKIQTNKKVSGEKAEFIADGVLIWNILGVNLYNEPKSFSGTID